jgi:uncharacterized protein (TIGR00730 family)
MKRISVFCGSNVGSDPIYSLACEKFAEVLGDHNLGAVYGGGNVGLMGVLADAMIKQGSEIIGVIPQKLMDKELAHMGITELHVVNTMHERKALMAELSNGFVALPGGVGTLEEIIEVYTWSQLGYHHKPCGFLNVEGYYDCFVEFLDEMVQKKFLRQIHRDSLIIEEDPEKLIHRFLFEKPIYHEKWI